MKVKHIETEWFQDYKSPSLFIAFPNCTFKCEKECGVCCCHNSTLATVPNIEVEIDDIILAYQKNPITQALVLGGLEPFDSASDMIELLYEFRKTTADDVVIYTGYYPNEVSEWIDRLQLIGNVIVKWGRYRPGEESHWDDVLGVKLASSNQYAERIS